MKWEERAVAQDCRYFLGDQPCIWHKRVGVHCKCERYEKVSKRILIIKLDSMGDVLRTTCLLPALDKAHPGSAVTWITRPESAPLLENNPFVSEVISFGADSLLHVAVRAFDTVINLDTGRPSLELATLAKAQSKLGFVLDGDNRIQAANEFAETWFQMGLFDDLKRRNRRTYQEIMCDIVGIPATNLAYVLDLTDEEKLSAREHLLNLGVSLDIPVIGLNTGAGTRWQFKQWREDGFVELIERLQGALRPDVQLLLLGGKDEHERNCRILNRVTEGVFYPGPDNTVRHFASLTSFCDVLVSGDTLAMHIALALGRRVVVMFGPTSAPEIDLFHLGRKVLPDMSCLGCYKATCDFNPNCMQLISSDMVYEAVVAELDRSVKQDALGL